jgi:hypothetical protein
MRTVQKIDPRYFQIIFQCCFLSYGILALEWQPDYLHFLLFIFSTLGFQWIAESIVHKTWQPVLGSKSFLKNGGLSALISAASLCLLLKVNVTYLCVVAGFLTIASKFLIRFNNKHVFNPSAFAIVILISFSNKAWLSPAQWGNATMAIFAIATLGVIVITKVQRLDVCLAFLITFTGLLFYRQIVFLKWPVDYFLHSLSTGSLLLFTFFMISDPKTAPDNKYARILWAVCVGALAYYMAVFQFKNATPIKALILLSPLTPLLNYFFKAPAFLWNQQPYFSSTLNKQPMQFSLLKTSSQKAIALFFMAVFTTSQALPFCGFYVAKGDGTLKNKTSQVIMVRDGEKNVITMYNDFKGNYKDFAMVVPVPVVLAKQDIKVVRPEVFNILNNYSQPRLVEYYDENPCELRRYENREMKTKSAAAPMAKMDMLTRDKNKVTIEAQYQIGEYDILILSALESTALKNWLTQNNYKLPAGAEEVLDPYIKSNLKFFVVKVNEEQLKKSRQNFLSPIQISFNSPKFMLPIRLGMANADGDQDLIVYAFTKKGRVECTNYRTVEMPTGKNIPLFVKNNFSAFYGNLFQHQYERENKSIAFLEYAWDVSPTNFMKCDPCVAEVPDNQAITNAGVWWLMDGQQNVNEDAKVFFTRLHVRYNRQNFPQDLQFQYTPNTTNYQARYIVTHPASGNFDCLEGKKYLDELKERRKNELEQLTYLTGKTYENWDLIGANVIGNKNIENDIVNNNGAIVTSVAENNITNNNEIENDNIPDIADYKAINKNMHVATGGNNKGIMALAIISIGIVVLMGIGYFKKPY